MNPTAEDLVVLVDDAGNPTGTAPRATVHTVDTPLHLAFSLYLQNDAGHVLLTRRAHDKPTWPGVWTNACCGHLKPGETAQEAAVRRIGEELGATLTGLRLVLPDFRYRAVDAHGIVENEFCPVFVATLASDPVPDPDEISQITWVGWDDLVTIARRAPALLSPWSVAQVNQLADEGDPWRR